VTQATPVAAFRNAGAAADGRAASLRTRDRAPARACDLAVTIHTDLAAAETEWRGFEAVCEGTPFQAFAWLETWHRHIGQNNGTVPAIVSVRFTNGAMAMLAPLAVEHGRWARRLCWLGQDLCDYNAPLLAREFSQRVPPDLFAAFWREVRRRLQADPRLSFDWIEFEKMPQTIGVQANPFLQLGVTANANSAHLTQLTEDWETFYRTRRSSATRRHDRAKHKRMSAYGAIRFVEAAEADDARRTLITLMEQKSRSFARKGIADMFARPGYRDFFLDFASHPATRHLAHISRLDVGAECAAANFGIVFGDCYYHVLASHGDGAVRRYGPGALHLRELMAYAISRGLRRFDFTIGDERYKREWSDLLLKLYDYSAAASWRGVGPNLSSALRRRVKRFIKQTPTVWRLAIGLRQTIGALFHRRADRD
jgi:CelD/BcsL family acetyltransferase involved in cellulose biosynthesis